MTHSPRHSGFQAFHLQASEDFPADTQLLARAVRVVHPSFIAQIPQKQSKGHKARSCVTLQPIPAQAKQCSSLMKIIDINSPPKTRGLCLIPLKSLSIVSKICFYLDGKFAHFLSSGRISS